MRPLIFLGCRQATGQLAVVAEAMGYEVKGILDFQYYQNPDYPTQKISNIPFIGSDLWLLDKENAQAQEWLNECDFFVADYFGGPMSQLRSYKLRIRRIQMLEHLGIDSPNLIHPNTDLRGLSSKYTDGSLRIGKGNFIDNDVVIHQDAVEIGDYCVMAWGTRISHGAKVGNNVTFCPKTFYQECDIGNDVFLGHGSELSPFARDRITIGDRSTVWANSSIIKDVPDDSIYTHKDRIMSKRAVYKQ